uniref:C-type lectin-1 n=1 Tax=Pinctada imbricata TaxID=66713 RepID=A0A0D5CBX6_PINIB|nr:C-type lectin-1 [Pinctada imbricata]
MFYILVFTVFVGNIYAVERVCPLGWMSHKNHCYMIVSKPTQSWFNANIQCENQNSTLAKLDSRSELEWIYQRLLARNEPVHFWIGGNRLKRFEEWRWVSDGQRIEFFDFYKTQPNQNTSLCIALWHPFKYDWADEPCTSSYGYICKI